MKRLMKKTISIVCAVALLFTGLAFVPQTVSADDVWYDMDNTWPKPHPLLEVPEGETSLWTGCTGPGTEIKCANAFMLEGFKWNTVNPSGEAAFFKTIDLKDVACVDNGSGLEKPVAGTYYNMHVKLTYTPPSATNYPKMKVETSGGIKNLELTQWDYKHSKLHPEEDVLEHEIDGVVCMKPGEDFKFCINYGWLSDEDKGYMKKGIFEITEFTLTGDNSWTTAESNKDVSVPDTPWSVRANYNDDPSAGSYGIIQYKVGDNPSDISDTSMRLISTVGKQETYPDDYPDVEKRNKPVDSADRWWWTSATLKNYLPKAGVQYLRNKYTGTIVLNSTKATEGDCKLFVYVDGKEYPFSIVAGRNELTIPEFVYKDDSYTTTDDIKFLFDEMPETAEVNIESIEFNRVDDGWTNVPNKKPNFTVGPWNMVATYDITGVDEQTGNVKGIFGALQYKANKENPSSYSDYTVKVLSNSNWLEGGISKYSCFERLDNYCEDRLDPGDKYNLTIKINSTKPTVPSSDPQILDQLIVVVGDKEHYYDLVEGENTITMTNQTYSFNENDPHEQILFNFDGLQIDTEITVTDIQLDSPNDGWTNVPNKSDTQVGAWQLFSWKDDNHWSKMAYKANSGVSGLGAYDIKVRRTTSHPEQLFSGNASLATLSDYLLTAKDTAGQSINNGDNYNVKATISTRSQDNSIDNYGKIRMLINEQPFDFNLKPGTNTYDINELTGNRFTYDSSKAADVVFELDEVTARSILNISNIQIIPTAAPGSVDVPNAEAVKPDGTPWVLYAITDSESDRWGAMKYKVDGDPTQLSSVKINLKSVSGDWVGLSTMATLNDYFSGLQVGQKYGIRVKAHIDESNVEEQYRHVTYAKQLRVMFDDKNFDFNVADPANDTYTFEDVFTYDGNNNRVTFQFDQLLRGTDVYIESVELFDPTIPTTTPTPSTSTPSSTTPGPETSSGGQATTVNPKTTATVQAPGKAKINKVFKKKKSAKKVKIKLKKVKGAVGYQVAVYKSKKKAKKNKKALVKKYTKKLKYTIKSKKLKNKKKLYLKARAYVLKPDGTKLFGKWSKIKVGKVKK